MNKTTRISASFLGGYAGVLGIEHGIFEILQGNIPTEGILINAMGPNCQPKTVWHACFPALTLLPNYLVTGLLAAFIGVLVLVWAVGFVNRKHGGVVLILLSTLMIPVGGGFIPAFIGIFGGVAGTRIHAPLTWWRRRSPNTIHRLSNFWPWTLILLIVWIPGSWILGHFSGELMLSLGFELFLFFDLVLPLLIVFSALAQDIGRNSQEVK